MFIKAIDDFMIDRIFQPYVAERKKLDPNFSSMGFASFFFSGTQVMTLFAAITFVYATFDIMNIATAVYVAGLSVVVFIARYMASLCDTHRKREIYDANPFGSMRYCRFLALSISLASSSFNFMTTVSVNSVMFFSWCAIFLFMIGLYIMPCDIKSQQPLVDDGNKLG